MDKIPAEDIFDFSPPKQEIPSDWLDKVSVQSYSYGTVYGGRGSFGFGRNDYDDFGISSFGSRGAQGKNVQSQASGKNPSLAGNTDQEDALTHFLTTGELPKGMSLDMDVAAFCAGLGGMMSMDMDDDDEAAFAQAMSEHHRSLAEAFDPDAIHEPGADFTKLVGAYMGYTTSFNSDGYRSFRTLGIYEAVESLAKDWEALTGETSGGFILRNTHTGISVSAQAFIKDISPLATYVKDMQDAEAFTDDDIVVSFAQDVWEFILDINEGNVL